MLAIAPMRKFSGLLLVTASFICLSACSSTPSAQSKPLPELSFTNVTPYHVDAAKVEVENKYVPGSDPKDVSSTFAVSPDVAVRRYAENRLQPGGTQGALKLVIEDARIYLTEIEQTNQVVNWMGAGKQDQYEIFMKLNLFYTDELGMQTGRRGELNFNRTLTMPASVSLAERELRQMNFMEQLMKDVDAAVSKALSERFSMVDTDALPLPTLLSTPQVR